MNFTETKEDLRILFKQCGVKINLASNPFRNNAIIDVLKINKIIGEESEAEYCLSEMSKYSKILFICKNIDKLPDWVKEVQNVSGFILLGALSDEFFNDITYFKQMKELLILNAEISMLPSSIGQLRDLQYLIIRGTTINKLPSIIGFLDSLQVLDISNTPVCRLPDSIGRLQNLHILDISDTMVEKIPDSVRGLNALDHLYLYGLTINKMPWFKNCVKGIGTFCFKFDNHIPFSLRHQPASLFEQPPEIIQQYYDEEKVEINNYKVIFLGFGAAGKTHTIKRMKNHGKLQEYDTRQTDGIDIYEETFVYQHEKITLSFWDFGGQTEMYSMHRCFLTERSCYVVVVSNRIHESLQDQAQYWLRNINIFAKRSPVVIAVNNSEQTYSEGVNTELLRKQFPDIMIGDAVSYSAKCSPENEFNQVTNAVLKQIHNLDSYKMEFPKSWVRIINEIKSNQNDYISKKQYRKICENNNVNSPAIRKWLLSWFHDLGYCFCNHIDTETGDELEDYQVIEPNWITTAMYRINHAHDAINGNKYYANVIDFEKGKISPTALYFLINDIDLGGQSTIRYELEEIDYVLKVMRKFKLSYRISSDLEFIPVLCNYDKPFDLYKNESDESMVYYIEYAFLPDSIVHRLMISLYQDGLNLSTVWRYGFCLDIKNHINLKDSLSIIVEMNRGNDMLELRIFGKTPKDRWEWLWYILELIRQINLSTNCQIVEQYVEKKKNNQIAHLPLSSILKAKEKGHSEIWSTDGGQYESYLLSELVGETFGEETYNNAIEIAKDNDLNSYNALVEAQICQNLLMNVSQNGTIPSINLHFHDKALFIHGDHTSISNNPDIDQMLSLMDRFLNLPALTEAALDELQEALGDENSELKEEMQKAKDNNEDRKGILSKAVERTQKAINTANNIHDTVESGINTGKKIVNTVGKIIRITTPLIAVLSKYVGA